jgi:signal transduction histidine kinase/CheY-like chemotaxis protein
VTERLHHRQLEEQTKRAQAADNRVTSEVMLAESRVSQELAAYVFHELRNDSNATVGVLNSIAEHAHAGDAKLPPSVLAMLPDAVAHAHHATQVITNMLDWTKMRHGKLTSLPSTPLVVDELLANCECLVRHLVVGRPIELKIDCEMHSDGRRGDGASPLRLHGPYFHLQQILVNLLTNACKYTHRGYVKLSAHEVAARGGAPSDARQGADAPAPEEEAAGGEGESAHVRVLFAVEDSGEGVHPSRRERIFESFVQGASPGTGLGLPLCKMLCEAMGSKLDLNCPESGGSVFSFAVSLPRGEPQQQLLSTPNASEPLLSLSPSSLSPPPPGHSSGLPKGLRVLVADDVKLNRMLLKRALGKVLDEPKFHEACTGEEALKMLSERAFDVAVLDEIYDSGGSSAGGWADGESSEQPGLRGSEVARRLRELEAAQRAPSGQLLGGGVLLIGCTGIEGAPEHAALARASGQDLVWPKPTPPASELLKDIREGLVHRSACSSSRNKVERGV